jgi:ankyrin repeat protein
LAAEQETGTGQGAADVWWAGGFSALHLAAAKGRERICRYLVQDLGFPVDARSSSGESPLVLAARSGDTASAAYLLERGGDPRSPDTHGQTPLHWAAFHGTWLCACVPLVRAAPVSSLIFG